MFPLVETIRIAAGIPRNLDLHETRFMSSFMRLFGKFPSYRLRDVIEIPGGFREGVVKLRFLYGKDGYNLEFLPYKMRKVLSLKLVECDEIDYSLKFTDRSKINMLLNQKGDADDILIVKNGVITDTSFANVVFYTGSEWITPATPLLEGTCRAKLLAGGRIAEARITPQDLSGFRAFSLINAMLCADLTSIPIENIQRG